MHLALATVTLLVVLGRLVWVQPEIPTTGIPVHSSTITRPATLLLQLLLLVIVVLLEILQLLLVRIQGLTLDVIIGQIWILFKILDVLLHLGFLILEFLFGHELLLVVLVVLVVLTTTLLTTTLLTTTSVPVLRHSGIL